MTGDYAPKGKLQLALRGERTGDKLRKGGVHRDIAWYAVLGEANNTPSCAASLAPAEETNSSLSVRSGNSSWSSHSSCPCRSAMLRMKSLFTDCCTPSLLFLACRALSSAASMRSKSAFKRTVALGPHGSSPSRLPTVYNVSAHRGSGCPGRLFPLALAMAVV